MGPMGNVVRLEQPQSMNDRRADMGTEGEGAEIVLFPGVRYERWDEVSQALEARKMARSINRDVIEL
ncbi:MAG TPA: hypothetical protein VMX97_02260 [Hyphomicrobiaceae bacterium]|nr:hypothetical protein [Hyphomicrobiaceae bacterium]